MSEDAAAARPDPGASPGTPAPAPLVRWKDLCLDVSGDEREQRFWADTLRLTPVPHRERSDVVQLRGDTPERTVWLNTVPQPHRVKNRVHLDVHVASLDQVLEHGATTLSRPGQFRWTVLADPDGGELCAFVRERPPAHRLYEVVVDSAEPRAQAAWWRSVWGGTPGADDTGAAWLEDVPGLPCEAVVFVPVPEPKTVPNRVHWDVDALGPDALAVLVARGATVVRRRGDDRRWDVLADPEGNEFCVFPA